MLLYIDVSLLSHVNFQLFLTTRVPDGKGLREGEGRDRGRGGLGEGKGGEGRERKRVSPHHNFHLITFCKGGACLRRACREQNNLKFYLFLRTKLVT